MRFRFPVKPHCYVRKLRRFALWPTRQADGHDVWLEVYVVEQRRRYDPSTGAASWVTTGRRVLR